MAGRVQQGAKLVRMMSNARRTQRSPNARSHNVSNANRSNGLAAARRQATVNGSAEGRPTEFQAAEFPFCLRVRLDVDGRAVALLAHARQPGQADDLVDLSSSVPRRGPFTMRDVPAEEPAGGGIQLGLDGILRACGAPLHNQGHPHALQSSASPGTANSTGTPPSLTASSLAFFLGSGSLHVAGDGRVSFAAGAREPSATPARRQRHDNSSCAAHMAEGRPVRLRVRDDEALMACTAAGPAMGALHDVVGKDGVLMIQLQREANRSDITLEALASVKVHPQPLAATDAQNATPGELRQACPRSTEPRIGQWCSKHGKPGEGCRSENEQAIAHSHMRALQLAHQRPSPSGWTAIIEARKA